MCNIFFCLSYSYLLIKVIIIAMIHFIYAHPSKHWFKVLYMGNMQCIKTFKTHNYRGDKFGSLLKTSFPSAGLLNATWLITGCLWTFTLEERSMLSCTCTMRASSVTFARTRVLWHTGTVAQSTLSTCVCILCRR